MIKKLLFIHELKKYAKNHPEGFTIYIDSFKIHEIKPDETLRYAVSITNNNNKRLIKSFIRSINIDFKGFIGGWIDKSSNTFYLDQTEVLRSLNQSISIARKYNQISIYDL